VVDWRDSRRLLDPIGNFLPVEREASYYLCPNPSPMPV